MMEWGERIAWLLVGCAIGYVVCTLQNIKKEVHEVDNIVTERDRNEGGFVRVPLVLDVMIVILFALTIWSAFRVEQSVDNSEQAVIALQEEEAQDNAQDQRIAIVTKCTLSFTAQTIRALNERTTYTQEQADANVLVLREQSEFLSILLEIPPVSDEAVREALESYLGRLQQFDKVAKLNKDKTTHNPYPTNKDLYSCLMVDPPKENTDDES